MIYLEDRHRAIIQNILNTYPYTFYAFGSRVKGNHHRLSDLDLCFMEPIPANIISHIEEDFEESDLPYKVDIVNWQTCSEEFQKAISTNLVPFSFKRYHTLTSDERDIMLLKGTEPPSLSPESPTQAPGVYICKRCDAPLYLSSDKFSSGCGWPSFDDEIIGAIKRKTDADGYRTEILCNYCQGHLGHVFTGENLTGKNSRHCVNSLSLRFISALNSKGFSKAIFAGGCFWGIEYLLKKIPGVLHAQSGYTGGHVVNPSYKEVCTGLTDHAEAVEISYDPKKISYQDLVAYFFKIHNPAEVDKQGPDIGSQYRSAIFYYTKEQYLIACNYKKNLEQAGEKIATNISPASFFYPAEDYHQNYFEKTGQKPHCHLF